MTDKPPQAAPTHDEIARKAAADIQEAFANKSRQQQPTALHTTTNLTTGEKSTQSIPLQDIPRSKF